ncbi:LysE family transporter [Halovenus sp. WSH3]|uniref:LysE family transporter n=1 Tax=Halovenus carboxidivorans TaxID=2692199 RepID=A0A6B0T875_9EURY|nr:LysE family translocator [Halovenus carboxidivorans]MXR51401.1 LysE family transporter [Halovenus carboxidivorans]
MVGTAVLTVGAGVLFGLALAAPPGPMNAIIAEESVRRGWGAGFRAGLGAMVADFVFFLLALAGLVAVIEAAPRVRAAMVAVGGVLMLYFGYGALASVGETLTGESDGGPNRGFLKAFVLAITNPYQILFWLTVGVGLLSSGTLDVLSVLPLVGDALAGLVVVETGSPLLVGGLFGGIVVWIVGFPAALVTGRNRVDRLAPAVAVVSGLVLVGAGVLFVIDGLSTLV